MAGIQHKLPKHIERCLAALSKLYAQDGQRTLQEIIVNAQTHVVEECAYYELGTTGRTGTPCT